MSQPDDGAAPRWRGRATWSLVDQGLSSVTNFALTILVARMTTAAAFGAFALAYGLALVVLGATRGLVSNPLMVRFTDGGARARDAEPSALGALVVAGSAIALVTALGATVVTPTLRTALLALAVVLPGVVVQDGVRFLFFARGAPREAALTDFVWAVAQFASLGVLALDGLTAAEAVLAWGGAALLAGGVGCWRAGVVPHVGRALDWLRDHRDLGVPFALDNVLKVGDRFVLLGVVGIVAGLIAVGSIRGGNEILGLMRPVLVAIPLVGLPEGVRLLARGHDVLRRGTQWLLVAVAALTGTWALVVLTWGSWIGPRMLGASWPGARTVLVPLAIGTVAMAAAVPPSFGLRVLGDAVRGLRARTTSAVATVGLGAAGAAAGGVRGAAIGLAVAEVGSLAIWWRTWGRGLAEHRATGATGDRAAGDGRRGFGGPVADATVATRPGEVAP